MFKRASGGKKQQDDLIDIDERLAPYVDADPGRDALEPELAGAASARSAPVS